MAVSIHEIDNINPPKVYQKKTPSKIKFIRSEEITDREYVKKYNGEDNYFKLPNIVANDNRIGNAASLLIYMMSKPYDWKFSSVNLIKALGIGKRAFYTRLKILTSLGYVQQIRERNDRGFGRLHIYVSPEKTSNSSEVLVRAHNVDPRCVYPRFVECNTKKDIYKERSKQINNINNINKYTAKLELPVSELSLISYNVPGNVPSVQPQEAPTISSFEEAYNSFDLDVNSVDEYQCDGIDVLLPLSSSHRPSEPISEAKLVVSQPNQGETMLMETKERECKRNFDAEFNEFWRAYPKKRQKQKAKDRYINILKKDPDMHGIIMDGLRKQNEEREVSVGLELWVPDPKWPAAWIKDARWEDETETGDQLNEKHRRSQQKGFVQHQRPESKYQRNSRLAHRDLRNINEKYRAYLVNAGRSEEEISAELNGLGDISLPF